MFEGSGNIRLGNTLSVGTPTFIEQDLSVSRLSRTDGTIHIGNNLSINKSIWFRGPVTVKGAVILNGNSDVPIEKTQLNTDDITFINNTISVSSTTIISNNLSIASNTYIDGNIDITGSFLVNSVPLSGSGSSNSISLIDGSASTPPVNFENESNTGIYRINNINENVVIGNELIGYNNRLDKVSGYIYVATDLFGSIYSGGTLTKIKLWSENPNGYFTPILLEYTGGQYVVRAIFNSLTGLLGFTDWQDLVISSGYGSANITNGNFCFGWKEGPLSGTNSQYGDSQCVMTNTETTLSNYQILRTTNTQNLSTSNIGNSITFGTDIGFRVNEYQLQIQLPSGSTMGFSIKGSSTMSMHNINGLPLLELPGSLNSNGFYSPSDLRIKKDITDIPDDISLQVINGLKPKKYRYIDPEFNKSSGDVYGFLSQEVIQVIPEAIYRGTNTIPDIMLEFNVVENEIIYTNHGLKDDDVITFRILTNNNIFSNKIKVLDSNRFRILNDTVINTRIFIVGKRVNDYLFLDKQYLMTFVIGAIQQLSTEIVNLKNRLSIFTLN